MDHGVVDLDPDRIQPGTREGREVLAHDVAQGSQWERGAMDAGAQAAEAEKDTIIFLSRARSSGGIWGSRQRSPGQRTRKSNKHE